jgi:hypothetical protein
MIALAVAVSASLSMKQSKPAGGTPPPPTPQDRIALAEPAAAVRTGLSDLDAMTFGCPKAALNAAAREAARVKSQGTYQFSYFRIVNDSHHSSYEVHFKSNYEGEPDLKYCIAMYCQQGWDPTTTKAEITLIGKTPAPVRTAAHRGDCGEKPAPVKRGAKH